MGNCLNRNNTSQRGEIGGWIKTKTQEFILVKQDKVGEIKK
jgi:hypothetical protein